MSVTVVDAGKVSEYKMDVSHIVTVGCSFTYCQGLDSKLETGWPALVAKHFNAQLTNLAMPGIGNDTIHRRTYEYITENLKFKDTKPLVILAWSQIDRHEQWFNERMNDPMFYDYHLISKPESTSVKDLYEKVYLDHYDETNFYRKTLLYKLSLFSLLESLDIPYITTNYMSLERTENILKVEKEFSGLSKKVNENPFKIGDLSDITKWSPKLPCGHDTAESMIPVSNYVIENIKKLHPNINFRNDISHLRLIDFIKTGKYHKRFPDWCHFVL
jgi:hypothetical protein